MVLSLSASIMSPRTTNREHARIPALEARVPKAPLAVLVLLTLPYAAAGTILAYMAAKAGAGPTKNV